jgi:DNA-binding beta-propeller fold protein YncE/mono/diheme cytochrome c family protein
MLRAVTAVLGVACFVLVFAVGGEVPRDRQPAHLRRPIALSFTEDGRRLLVANQRSGTISIVDPESLTIRGEPAVGSRLSDLCVLPDGRVLALEESAGELLLLQRKGDDLHVAHRLAVGKSPVTVRAAADGSRACVACLWEHSVAIIELPAGRSPVLGGRIAVPFAPRLLLPLPKDQVLVADSFGGKLAVLDTAMQRVASVRSLPAHNIRGVGVLGRDVVLSHQVLHEDTPTQENEVRWGNIIGNMVRFVPLDDVLRPDADLVRSSRVVGLGEFGHGAADPAGLAVRGGEVVLTIAGTGEVAFGPQSSKDWPRIRVGQGPTAVALAPSGRRAFVANTFSDSLSVICTARHTFEKELSLGLTPPLSPAERGEELFHDGRLSREGWMSCQSCHTDGHSNGGRSDTLGDGSYGAPKRVLSLLGVGDTGPWAWNGSMADLKSQLRQSVRSTMQGEPLTEEQTANLEAFLRTLAPPPGLSGDEGAVRRGKAAFDKLSCNRCHVPPTYTSPRTYDVGVKDEVGKSVFNPPSLRGAGHALAFFHDNRAATLEEVFTRFHHQVPRELSRGEVEDLAAFLRSL